MWFDNEKTRGAWVTWYWAPEGSKPLSFPTLYTSETWDGVHWFCPGAGEDDQSNPVFYNGTAPGPFKGKSFCGKQEWFENGCPSDAPPLPQNAQGLPKCCFGRGAYSDAYSGGWDVFRGVRK
jgi:hypothetical protein